MKLAIPLTGTVLREGSVWGKGELVGDPSDPIRLVSIDLGKVSWRMVDVDLENEEMIVEIEPASEVKESSGELRPATEQEKIGFLQHAKNLIEGHTKVELYQISGSPKLKRPFKEKK